jgi:hypothetical protein
MPRKARLSPRHSAMSETIKTKRVKAPAEEEIDRAVERVYQRYGPDLSVFFQAVNNHHGQLQLGLDKHEHRDQDPGFHLGD